jgi:hypothetical protein
MYNPQMYVDRLNSQIRELEALKGQIPPMQQPITQNFQLAPTNSIKYAENIEEVEKNMIIGDTPFFSNDLSILWIKNVKGEIKSYELKEIIQKDEKDLKIEYLEAQLKELKEKNNESNANVDESTTNTNQE